MYWLNGNRIKLVVVGIVAAIVLGGGRTNAEIIMSEPTNVGPVINDSTDVQECDFSHDGLELYFSANRPGGYGRSNIWVAIRETINDSWQEPVNLGPNVNSSGSEIEPSISGDSLQLYFASSEDYYTRVCTRPSRDAPWGSPVLLLELGEAWRPDISVDGLSLYFESKEDIWVTRRDTVDDPWSEPVNLGPNVNSSGEDFCPSISTDGLTLVFMRGYTSMWATTRKSIDDDWGPAVDLGFNRTNFNGPALSPDGSTLYFDANTQYWGGYGSGDILQVKFIPIVDFNSDEIVDIADLAILIEHWDEEESPFDIAPLPLGDGMVDEADLIVLMSHWGQQVYDPSLIAHWKLDETEGDVAYDSARTNDAAVLGDPAWLPEGGMVGGAIAFDGIDDYIDAPFILNPGDGEFSVFAWINGGAPGQAVLSQADGSNLLCLDSVEGYLMTELKGSGRSIGGPLLSEVIVSDETWHQVGLVWDGSCRCLYVDGVEVVKDANPLSDLESAEGSLYFGVGSTLAPDTFFSGLIDDVRIYNRAVIP